MCGRGGGKLVRELPGEGVWPIMWRGGGTYFDGDFESRDNGNSKEKLQDYGIYLFVDNEDVRVCKVYNFIYSLNM